MPRKPSVPLSDATFRPWLEKLIGAPLHKKAAPNPRPAPSSGKEPAQ